ncbi:MAG: hypothetical protein WCG02_00910 [Candidatus Taylorbacteria bacterium]
MQEHRKRFPLKLILGLVLIIAVAGAYYFRRADRSAPLVELPMAQVGHVENITASSSVTSAVVDIRARKFELLTVDPPISFGEALDIANHVASLTHIRPAFLLAISQEELKLEKTDMCYLTDLKTGLGVRDIDGMTKPKTMHPTRDIPGFLAITKKLNKDPLKTLVTCPMSFGWGGAMGPADFIPSTWMAYKSRIEKITGKAADPWDINDAFLAMGLFVADTGAKSKTHDGEWRSAMVYFSGSPKSGYNWYADGTMEISRQIEADIESLVN